MKRLARYAQAWCRSKLNPKFTVIFLFSSLLKVLETIVI